jgi:hypothetical protein
VAKEVELEKMVEVFIQAAATSIKPGYGNKSAYRKLEGVPDDGDALASIKTCGNLLGWTVFCGTWFCRIPMASALGFVFLYRCGVRFCKRIRQSRHKTSEILRDGRSQDISLRQPGTGWGW